VIHDTNSELPSGAVQWTEAVKLDHQEAIIGQESARPQPISTSIGNLFLSIIGWIPPIWFSEEEIKLLNRTKLKICPLLQVVGFILIFLVDFSDSVVDLTIFFTRIIDGKYDNDIYVILLGVMTIVARFLMGWYGVVYSCIHNSVHGDKELKDLAIATYFFIGLTVFMLEDGAATLFLANNTGDEDILMTLSMILSTICGIGFCLYNVFNVLTVTTTLFDLLDEKFETADTKTNSFLCQFISALLLCYTALGFAVSMLYLLVNAVLLNDGDKEDVFSENSLAQYRWRLVYYCGSALCVLLSSSLIFSFKNIGEKRTKMRRERENNDVTASKNATKKSIPESASATSGATATDDYDQNNAVVNTIIIASIIVVAVGVVFLGFGIVWSKRESDVVPSTESNVVVPSTEMCINSVQASTACFDGDSELDVTFESCSPEIGDWVGIYDSSANSQFLVGSEWIAWYYTCGDRYCEEAVQKDVLNFTRAKKRMMTGTHVAHLIRNGTGPIFSAIASSADFRIVNVTDPNDTC